MFVCCPGGGSTVTITYGQFQAATTTPSATTPGSTTAPGDTGTTP